MAQGGRIGAWTRARRLLAPERGDLAVVVVYAAASGALALALPVAAQALVNTVAFGQLVQPILVLVLLLAAGLTGFSVLWLLQLWCIETILQRVFVRAIADLGRRFSLLPDDRVATAGVAAALPRVFELPTIQKALAALLVEGVGVVLQTAVGLALLSLYHPLLLAFALALLLGLAVVVGLGRGAVDGALAESRAKYQAVAWLERVVRAPAAFRSRRGRVEAASRTDALARTWLQRRRAHFRTLMRQHVGGVVLAVLGNTALLGVGGLLVTRAQLTLGQLVAAEIVVNALAIAFTKLGKQFEALYDLVAASQKLGMLIDLPRERHGGEGLPGAGPMAVRARGLHFAHSGRREVLAGAGFELRAGEHAAITGVGGSGKSTLLELLAGLRAPERGAVELDGIDARVLSLAELREQVVLVRADEPCHGSLLEHVRALAPEATVADVAEVLKVCGLAPVVRDLPQGLETPLGSDAAPLSRSEVARLALARAMLARPRLLLLDAVIEALGLSGPGEHALLEVLFASDAAWTAVVTTTSLGVARRARRQLELRGGVAVEVHT
ncbi:MAG: ABC transporter ATP-binding protein [Deltaproteobacteria bacterium]|nr:ABC transporter ATP-binding protein [Deltaproteobacteria bacterium]MBK8238424.1 ABC transporter ATP-binding protein [Deltaproteobacteria bacterium]MBP7286131.1 ABC transporter ATP-binding protein [Nannocystaceae bacterium]